MIDEAEIHYLGDVQRLALKPGDIIVFKLRQRADAETFERIRKHMDDMLGGQHKIIILADGLEIGILSPESA